MNRNELPMYGLDKGLHEKQQAKISYQNEQEIRKWIDSVLQREHVVPPEIPLQQALKDGLILCEIMNRILPGSCKVNKTGSMPFHHMENINQFLRAAATQLGCKHADLFQTVELYENRDMTQVMNGLYSVARHARAKNSNIPALGPELVRPHHVEFSPEVLAAGKMVTSPQMGYNRGASQSGMSYGARRQIDAKVDAGATEPSSQTTGYAKGANQSGLSFGGFRQLDVHLGAGSPSEPTAHVSGFNKGANASGIIYGLARQIGGSDPKKSDNMQS